MELSYAISAGHLSSIEVDDCANGCDNCKCCGVCARCGRVKTELSPMHYRPQPWSISGLYPRNDWVFSIEETLDVCTNNATGHVFAAQVH